MTKLRQMDLGDGEAVLIRVNGTQIRVSEDGTAQILPKEPLTAIAAGLQALEIGRKFADGTIYGGDLQDGRKIAVMPECPQYPMTLMDIRHRHDLPRVKAIRTFLNTKYRTGGAACEEDFDFLRKNDVELQAILHNMAVRHATDVVVATNRQQARGHQDWHLVRAEEAPVLYANRDKGDLREIFGDHRKGYLSARFWMESNNENNGYQSDDPNEKNRYALVYDFSKGAAEPAVKTANLSFCLVRTF